MQQGVHPSERQRQSQQSHHLSSGSNAQMTSSLFLSLLPLPLPLPLQVSSLLFLLPLLPLLLLLVLSSHGVRFLGSFVVPTLGLLQQPLLRVQVPLPLQVPLHEGVAQKRVWSLWVVLRCLSPVTGNLGSEQLWLRDGPRPSEGVKVSCSAGSFPGLLFQGSSWGASWVFVCLWLLTLKKSALALAFLFDGMRKRDQKSWREKKTQKQNEVVMSSKDEECKWFSNSMELPMRNHLKQFKTFL